VITNKYRVWDLLVCLFDCQHKQGKKGGRNRCDDLYLAAMIVVGFAGNIKEHFII
jgi:hypothetical protein